VAGVRLQWRCSLVIRFGQYYDDTFGVRTVSGRWVLNVRVCGLKLGHECREVTNAGSLSLSLDGRLYLGACHGRTCGFIVDNHVTYEDVSGMFDSNAIES
jgi:hypothetical protein